MPHAERWITALVRTALESTSPAAWIFDGRHGGNLANPCADSLSNCLKFTGSDNRPNPNIKI